MCSKIAFIHFLEICIVLQTGGLAEGEIILLYKPDIWTHTGKIPLYHMISYKNNVRGTLKVKPDHGRLVMVKTLWVRDNEGTPAV